MAVVGAIFVPALPPERLRPVVVAADDAGVDELWLWEDCFREGGFTSSAAALAWTARVRVGIGILPLPLRNVALTAMEVATLARMFGGRFVVGVGHGVQDWMGQAGARPASPLTHMREHLVALRALVAGERVTTSGAYLSLDDVALDWPPAGPVPLHVGATGPRTLSLAGELGDGTVLTGGTSPEEVRRARATVDAGRATAGRTDPHRSPCSSRSPSARTARSGCVPTRGCGRASTRTPSASAAIRPGSPPGCAAGSTRGPTPSCSSRRTTSATTRTSSGPSVSVCARCSPAAEGRSPPGQPAPW